jgi:ATP-binding cassette subfamily D (ALD) protein 3
MIFNVKGSALKSAEELTKDYIRNSQYLSQLSQAVGQLVLIGNNLTTIAGYTSRVSELLEMVKSLSEAGNKPFTIVTDAPPAPVAGNPDEKEKEPTGAFREAIPGLADWLQKWAARCDAAHEARMRYRHASKTPPLIGGGKLEEGGLIKFEHVDIVSPEGKLLVRDLNVEVQIGQNVMVTGPNGAGKSSLFRVIGELWPLHNGRLVKPRKEDILFVPQKPYLVLGTLRDQIIYPHSQADMRALGITDDDLAHLLAVVDPARTITTQWRWDEVKDWFIAFSGGQKQRVAMARLFYHKPKYAILDECTSAVSDEVEDKLYETCKSLGTTLFTVSHRRSLARHHDYVLSFDGRGGWEFKPVNHAELAAQLAAPTPSTAV